MSVRQVRSSIGRREGSGAGFEWLKSRQAPVVALAVISALASVWFLVLSDGEYFFSDEWSRFSLYPSLPIDWRFHGLNGHLVFLQVLLYQGLLEIFGGDSYLPFRLLCLMLQLSAVWLLFIYLRPRVSGWLIVVCVSPLLFLGSAWVVTASAYGTLILTPIVLGLAALILLDRDERLLDLLVSSLLVLAVLAHSGSLPFLVGAAVLLSLGASRRLSRLWVVAPAALLYSAWFVWSRWFSPAIDFFGDPVTMGNVRYLPAALVEVPSAALASVSGTFYRLDESGALDFRIAPGYVLLVLSLIGLWMIWRRQRDVLSVRVLVPLSMLLAFAALIGFGMSDPSRQPTSPRYLYFTAMCVIWIFCEVSPVIRWRLWKYGVLTLVIVCGLLANASIYGKAASSLRDAGNRSRAAVTALVIAGPAAVPQVRTSEIVSNGTSDGAFSEWIVELDQRSIGKFGTNALDPNEIEVAGRATRSIIDQILVATEQIGLRPPRGIQRPANCIEAPIESSSDGTDPIQVRPGQTLSIETRNGAENPTVVGVSRFDSEPTALGSMFGRNAQEIYFPVDRSDRPWQVDISGVGPVRLCLSD